MESEAPAGMRILADRNAEGQTSLIVEFLRAEGWLDLISLQVIRFADVNLPLDSNDRAVWRFAQANGMLLVTDNRNMEDEDSLEKTIQDENQPTSLPVITIGQAERVKEQSYRERSAMRLLDIIIELDNNRGVGRLYIP